MPIFARLARLGRQLSSAALLAGLLGPLALGSPPVAAEPVNPIGGVRFEPQVVLAGQPLLLNGTGLRAQFIFKGYAAGLYLGQRASSADAVVAQGGAKRLQMRLLIDVPADEFIKAFHQGIERNNPPEVRARLAERAAVFDALLRPLGEIHNGDVVNLDFLPGRGLLFWHNGKQLGAAAIPGEDFYGALLRVFVGEHVSDERLRAGLLGRPA